MNRINKRAICLLLAALGAGSAAADPASPVGPELVLQLGALSERACWYQDQKYSLGARIQQGDIWLECGPQNEQESNGQLAWRTPAMVQPAAKGSPDRETITVGQ